MSDGTTRFTVWAPKRSRVEVAVQTGEASFDYLPLVKDDAGRFSAVHPVSAGALYKYRLDGSDTFPDPASRFQPQGPHGPSEVIDARAFQWTDQSWKGVGATGHIIYEIHLGTFSKAGTYAGLREQLSSLRELGVTLLELMPLHNFPGRFNWGYDGVNLHAPATAYGRPDELRALVDAAHAEGLGVILDVVYNHLGPDGNYLSQFTDTWSSKRYPNEWGEPPNFDGEGSAGMRELVTDNAALWISEYHLDGLRLDATQNLYDDSPTHIVQAIAQSARQAAGARSIFLVGESERQDVALITQGLDAIWVDDFHHCNKVIASGVSEAYTQDYAGSPRELVACALRNGLYQNQLYAWQKAQRGTQVRTLRHEQIVFYLQNHDQVANALTGERMHQTAGEDLARAMTTFFLLLPQTPMLFMGQEFFASTPFYYFVDHAPKLQDAVQAGRLVFLSQFPSAKNAIEREGGSPPTPGDGFELSKLNLDERQTHAKAYAFHRALISLRKSSPLFSLPERDAFEAAVLGDESLVLRWSTPNGTNDKLLVLNLGADVTMTPCSEPLLAPAIGQRWSLLFSSQDSRYGGHGAFASDGTGPWKLQGRCATVYEATRT